MKKMVVVLLAVVIVGVLSFLVAPYIQRPSMEVAAGCCDVKDKTGTGIVAPKRPGS